MESNNLDYLIDPIFRNVNRLFVLASKNGDNDPTRNYFNKYYMPLVEMKDFKALIDNKLFLIRKWKTSKKGIKKLSKCQEIMII